MTSTTEATRETWTQGLSDVEIETTVMLDADRRLTDAIAECVLCWRRRKGEPARRARVDQAQAEKRRAELRADIERLRTKHPRDVERAHVRWQRDECAELLTEQIERIRYMSEHRMNVPAEMIDKRDERARRVGELSARLVELSD